MPESLRHAGAPLAVRRPLLLVLHAAPTREDASNTRRSLMDGIRGWGLTMFEGPRLDDIELLAAEVITNAVVHTGMPVQVTAGWTGTAVRVEVADSSTEEPVAHDQFGEALTNGQGMNLVKALSNAWGVDVDHQAQTKIVWFECGPEHALTTGAPAVSEVALSDPPQGAQPRRAPRAHARAPRSLRVRARRTAAIAMLAAGHATVAGLLTQVVADGQEFHCAEPLSAAAPDVPAP